jgi:hypothetical protein
MCGPWGELGVSLKNHSISRRSRLTDRATLIDETKDGDILK